MRCALPYRRFIVGACLRNKTDTTIIKNLRQLDLVDNFSLGKIDEIKTAQFRKDKDILRDVCLTDKLAIAKSHDVQDYTYHSENETQEWDECWDIASVRRYREFIIVLSCVPSLTAEAITEMFNRKYSKAVAKNSIELFINLFWDLKRLTTTQIKQAISHLKSETLRSSILKLLFGNPVSAAKSVGASLRLNYALILEEMMADAYLSYKETLKKKNISHNDINQASSALMRIGDRLDKLSKRNEDVDVLRRLLEELKIEAENAGLSIDQLKGDREII